MNKIIKSFTQFINEEYQYDELENEYDDIDNLDNDTEESDDELDDDLDKVNEISDDLVTRASDRMYKAGQTGRARDIFNQQYSELKSNFPIGEEFGKTDSGDAYTIAKVITDPTMTTPFILVLSTRGLQDIYVSYDKNSDTIKVNKVNIKSTDANLILTREEARRLCKVVLRINPETSKYANGVQGFKIEEYGGNHQSYSFANKKYATGKTHGDWYHEYDDIDNVAKHTKNLDDDLDYVN